MKPTKEEIEEQMNESLARVAEGDHRFPGSSYEEGVSDALSWVLGESDTAPMSQ